MSEAAAKIGHNNPPVTVPEEADLLADLATRYPQVVKDLAEIEAAAADVPGVITDEATAGKLQALLKKTSSLRAQWKALRGVEKRPWSAVLAIVGNWFETAEEKADKIIETHKPRLTAFLDAKAEAARVAAEQEAERQRAEAERLAAEAAAAEQRRKDAEAAAARAVAEEAAARRRAEEEEERRKAAEAAREAAAAEEKRILAEKRDRERAEKERNTENLKQIRRHLKDAGKLHDAGIGDDTPMPDIEMLEALVRPGGTLATLLGQVFGSSLLTHEEVLEVEQAKIAMGNMRQVLSERLGDRERRKRAKLQKEENDRQAAAAAARKLERDEDERRTAEARVAREQAEAAAETAKAAHKAAQGEVREARASGREAADDVRQAERTAATVERQAEKAESRADRMEHKAGTLTDADASRTRGEGGSVGTLSGRWEPRIDDRDAIPLEELRGYLNPAAIDAAITLWQRAHQREWLDKRVDEKVEGALKGVTFLWIPDSRIAGGA